MSDLLLSSASLLAGFILAAALLIGRTRRLRQDLRQRSAELAEAREKLHGLEAELEAAQKAAPHPTAEILADNAELRRRMDELADLLLEQGPSQSGG